MNLTLLDTKVYLTIVGLTIGSMYTTNTVKNNIGNTLRARVNAKREVTMENFNGITGDFVHYTTAISLLRVIIASFIIEIIFLVALYIYCLLSEEQLQLILPNTECLCIEAIAYTLLLLCGLISITCVTVVILSPRQHLFTADWY